MINVNQITSQLAKMPDNALQQYAAMHKNDPYTVSLALAESNRRKEMRAGAMAGGQQQPTVVDQDISEMTPPTQQLPEDAGIGQLPAPNIQGMAGGGIVAFDEGGHVPHFANDGLVYAPYSYGNTGAQQQFTPDQLAEAKRLREMGMFDLLKEKFGPAWQALTSGPSAQTTKQETLQSGVDIGGPGSSPANTGTPVVGQTIDYKNQQGAQTTQNQQGTQGAPGAAPTTPGLPGLGGFEKRYADMLSKGEVSKEDRMKEFADIEKPAINKMQAMIDTQKEKLSTDKEQDFYMSLIQGGLAAAGATGPNALQNIAQGFEKGASNYNAALKDLRKAAQENSKMEMELARYESTGKKDALKAFYDHQDKVQGYKAQGIAQIMGHEISAGATMAAAGAPGQQERMFTRLGGTGGLEAGMRKYSELMGTEAKGAAAMAAKYTPQDIMMLEASGNPQDKMLAQQIRAYQQSMMLQPTNKPAGAVRP
jgi:hypothetical protein